MGDSHQQKISSLLHIGVRLQLDVILHFQFALFALLAFPATIIVFSLSHSFVCSFCWKIIITVPTSLLCPALSCQSINNQNYIRVQSSGMTLVY